MRYRIQWMHGSYVLETPPCTSSNWASHGRSQFRWPLHVVALRMRIGNWMWERKAGFKQEYGA